MTKFSRKEYYDECNQEVSRILARFGIKKPRCGFDIGLGWMSVIESAFEKMIAAGWDKELRQVKQKFGGLRIYINSLKLTDTELNRIITQAEVECSKICEICGKEREIKGMASGMAACNMCKGFDRY